MSAPCAVARYGSTRGPQLLPLPHLHGDPLVFVAEDDVWTAPLSGGRAYRLTADDMPAQNPRLAPGGARVSWTSCLTSAAPDRTGRTSVALVRGTGHRLTRRDGPARTLPGRPGVRARLARPLGDDRAVWVDDAKGEDAVCVAPLDAGATSDAGATPDTS